MGLTVGKKLYTTYIQPTVLTVVDQAWNLVAPVYVGRNISHGVDAVLVLQSEQSKGRKHVADR